MQTKAFDFDDFVSHLNPWQISVLVGAGITLAQFYSLIELWRGAMVFGGQVISTAFLFIIVDVLVDVIANINQLRKDRSFRLKWAKATYERLKAKTGQTFVFSAAISVASLFVPQIVTVLMTVAACSVFTMGAQCLESVLKRKGITAENNRVLRAFHDASYVMMPVLGFLQSTLNRVKKNVMTGLSKAFNWTKGAVMHAAGKTFETVQAFVTFLIKEGSKRFFGKGPEDPGPFQMNTNPA